MRSLSGSFWTFDHPNFRFPNIKSAQRIDKSKLKNTQLHSETIPISYVLSILFSYLLLCKQALRFKSHDKHKSMSPLIIPISDFQTDYT